MTIEPVMEIFGKYNRKTINGLREIIFTNFAASNNYGMIFTLMMAFDQQSDWVYLEHIKNIFIPYDTEFYYVELIASQDIRLERNTTENRLNANRLKETYLTQTNDL